LLLSIQKEDKDAVKTPADSIAIQNFEVMDLNERKRQQNLYAADMIYEALIRDQKVEELIR